jgi:hypothetical protein
MNRNLPFIVRGPLVMMLWSLVFGCAGCGYKVQSVRGFGPIEVSEHGQRKTLMVARLYYTEPLLGGTKRFVTEHVPTDGDRNGIDALLHSPPYRDVEKIREIGNLARDAGLFPSRRVVAWVLGTDPLIFGIEESPGVLEPVGPPLSIIRPMVSDSDASRTVTHLVRFADDGWQQLARATRPEDLASVPHEVVQLDATTTLGEALNRASKQLSR